MYIPTVASPGSCEGRGGAGGLQHGAQCGVVHVEPEGQVHLHERGEQRVRASLGVAVHVGI